MLRIEGWPNVWIVMTGEAKSVAIYILVSVQPLFVAVDHWPDSP